MNDKIPNTITKLSLEELQEVAWDWYKCLSKLERERKFSAVNRIEINGRSGRDYIRYLKDDEFMYIDIQDNNQTLKLFIDDDE